MSFLCSIPVIASLFGCATDAPLAVGYVEGEYVLLAPIEVAEVEVVSVRRGDRVKAGVTIVVLDTGDTEIAIAQAEAALAQAEAQLADLKIGKRPEEVAVLEAALTSALAQEAEADRVVKRVQDLLKRGIATQADFDTASTSLEVAHAAVGQAKANLAVAALPARPEAIKAADNQVKQAKAALAQAQWRFAKRSIESPAAGRVQDVIRSAGDLAGPSAPVVSILPDGAVKLKLYIPEESFSAVTVGTELAVHCDGCPPGLKAKVSYVSPDPEFTPPVIYSLETRQKLVYLIEARPDASDTVLQPGQIVDVSLPEGNTAVGQ